MKTAGTHSSKWSTAAVIFAIVAAGTAVAGVLDDPATDIAGCEEVVQPEQAQRINFAFVGEESYDNPDHPWFTEAKATAMSDALAQSLPAGTDVAFDAPARALYFGPIGSQEGNPAGGITTARGTIAVGGKTGRLTVSVQKSDEPPGPCFEGYVDERRTLDDGTVVDLRDGGVRAYTPDGTLIDASADNMLTTEQLLDLVTAPGLRVTTPVPAATAGALGICTIDSVSSTAPPIDEKTTRRLNDVLDAIPSSGLQFDRRLGSLLPDEWTTGGVCETLHAVGGATELTVEVIGGQPFPPAVGGVTPHIPPDGLVVERSTKSPTGEGNDMTPRTDTVTVTRASGTRIVVRSSGAEPLPFDVLETIGTADGLDVT